MTLPSYAMSQASFPEMYERHLVGALFRPFAEALVERAGVAPASRVLDVACGTGIVARLAKERAGTSGRVVGVDLSPQMLELARRMAPEVDWREGDALALPVEDGEFDVALCHQGLQFFPDRSRAIAEMRRALAVDGSLGIGVWRWAQESPVLANLQRVAEHRLGPIADARYSFGDSSRLQELLESCGLREVRVEPIRRQVRPEAAMFVRMNAMAFVGMSAAGKQMSEEERAKAAAEIGEASMEVARPHIQGEALVFELGSIMAIARR